MRVLALVDYLGNVGGAELSARTILAGLAAHDDVDHVSVVGVDRPGVERLEYPGVDVVTVSPPEFVESAPDFVADHFVKRLLARRARPLVDDADVVHAHHRRSTLALASLDAPVPTVGTVRDFWPICPISIYTVDDEQCTGCEHRLDDCVEYQGWDGATGVVAKPYLLAKRRHNRGAFDGTDAAVFIAEHLRETVGGAIELPDEARVIYNPVDVPDVAADEFDVATFVTASKLVREKGVETAIRAVARLDDCRLLVFGDGPRREDLATLAADLGCAERVEFRGRVDPSAVYRAMAGATATVFPSLWHEPFGRVTVESMQLGTPVVGSAVGGIGEVVDDGETGLLFEPGDVESLAERLSSLAAGDTATSESATRDAGERFRPPEVVESHLSLYRELAARMPTD